MFSKKKNVLTDAKSERQLELEGVMHALTSSQATLELLPDGTIVTANSKFLSALNYTLEEIEGKHHRILIPAAEHDSREYLQFWETLRSGQNQTLQCKRLGRDKKEVWLQASYCPIHDNGGKVTKIIKFAEDVTQFRLHQADYEGQLSAISRAQAVIEFNMQGQVLKANPNFLNTMDYTLDELVGQPHSLFLHPEESQSAQYTAFWEKMRSGEYVSGRVRRFGKNNKEVWLQATYNPIFDPSGRPVKVVKYASDISAEKSAEEDLQALISEATDVMGAIAQGDLTQSMQGNYNGELMKLAEAINRTTSQLSLIMSKVSENANTLQGASTLLTTMYSETRQAAHQAADQTHQVASAAKQITVNVNDVVAALQEMVTSVDQVSTNSTEAASVADKAVTLADSAKINVNQLAESSNDIGAVIKVINSIADQTNLLALNATIEAARAGDAGKGFAVVANEVKELAKETARATEEVSVKISAIQNDSQVAVKAINDIGSTIGSISDNQNAIAKTVGEQSVVSGDISRSVHEVAEGSNGIEMTISLAAKLATENQERADSSQGTTSELDQLAGELSDLVGQFKLRSA